MRKATVLALFTVAFAVGATFTPANALDLVRTNPAFHEVSATFNLSQALESAQSGQIIQVPEGVYEGSFTLREGVTLLGAGAGKSILRGSSNRPVVIGAKNAMVMGFTIEGGHAGIDTDGAYMGIFQNDIRNNAQMGVHVIGGSAVIANNHFSGNGGLGAIATNSSNPFILNNTIEGNEKAVWAWYHPSPVVMNNRISGNAQSIFAGAGAEVVSSYNEIDRPAIALEGSKVDSTLDFVLSGGENLVTPRGYTNSINPNAEIGIAFSGHPTIEIYQNLMHSLVADAVYHMPSVRYDLGTKAGMFGVTTRFPNPNFTVQSSTPDTRITDIVALDTKTEFMLETKEIQVGSFPAVQVRDTEAASRQRDRYVLDNLFFHHGSYTHSGNGHMLFERETAFARIEVLLPEGWEPVAVNLPYTRSEDQGRTLLTINDPGHTLLKIEIAENYLPGLNLADLEQVRLNP